MWENKVADGIVVIRQLTWKQVRLSRIILVDQMQSHGSSEVEEGSRREGQSGDRRRTAPASWPTFEDRGRRGREDGSADRSKRQRRTLSWSLQEPGPGGSLIFARETHVGLVIYEP